METPRAHVRITTTIHKIIYGEFEIDQNCATCTNISFVMKWNSACGN